MSGLTYDFLMAPIEALGLRRLRGQILKNAEGEILEIGAGTGLNLSHYPNAATITALEPDDSKRVRALKRLKKMEQIAQVIGGNAENLDFDDGAFEMVVATLVFCTIAEPQKAMNEVFRVLKPGGRFLLLEHVKSPNATVGQVQDWATPIWKIFTEGCHLNRDPEPPALLAGFELTEKKVIWNGLGKILHYVKPIS